MIKSLNNRVILEASIGLPFVEANKVYPLSRTHFDFHQPFLVAIPSVRSLWFGDLQRVFTSSDVSVVF